MVTDHKPASVKLWLCSIFPVHISVKNICAIWFDEILLQPPTTNWVF